MTLVGEARMEFGFFDWIDTRPAPLAEIYEDRLKLIEFADRAGFSNSFGKAVTIPNLQASKGTSRPIAVVRDFASSNDSGPISGHASCSAATTST
jgi:hypothetical protein